MSHRTLLNLTTTVPEAAVRQAPTVALLVQRPPHPRTTPAPRRNVHRWRPGLDAIHTGRFLTNNHGKEALMSSDENKRLVQHVTAESAKGTSQPFVDAVAGNFRHAPIGGTPVSGTYIGIQDSVKRFLTPRTPLMSQFENPPTVGKGNTRLMFVGIGLAGCFLAAACSNATVAAPPVPPPSVSVVEVGAEDVPIYSEYAAQTFARDMVEVRGRVDGYIEERLFQVGSTVNAGELLYVLDLRPYQAEVAKAAGDLAESEANLDFARGQVGLLQAEADLAQSEANRLKARQDVERLQPLVDEDAAPKKDLDNALADLQASEAYVKARTASVQQARLSASTQIDSVNGQAEANRALLQTAELNLEYATIRAPIGGRIGDSLVQVGGLVTLNAAQPLTTIVPLDPIWVRFKVSEAEALAFQRLAAGGSERTVPLQLTLSDGTVHPQEGRFENTLNHVDPRTGTLEVQATFPNPQHTLLPGQFGRVRVRTAEKENAILVPQRAVQELQGLQSVLAIDPENKVVVHGVVTSDRIGDRWIVEQGLKPGDRVIVEGLQKAAPGTVVDPKPYNPSSGQPGTTGGQ